MKRISILTAVLGLLTLTALIAYSGQEAVAHGITSAGWGILLVILVRILETAGAGGGWSPLVPASARLSLSSCFLVRWIREAVNNLLPVAQVGGEVVGTRLLTFFGMEVSLAGAVILVDLVVQVATQLLFTAVGLVVLVALTGDTTLARVAAGGLALASVGVLGFYMAQRSGTRQLVRTLLVQLVGDRTQFVPEAVDKLYDNLSAIHQNWLGVALSAIIHMVVWFLGALEVWIALSFMGFSTTYAQALVLESLGQAVRAAAFLIPGALGAQEAGFVALCASFGIPASSALALSLVKRVADLAVGVPGLLAWQALEARRVLSSPK
jgi:putative membrane protein